MMIGVSSTGILLFRQVGGPFLGSGTMVEFLKQEGTVLNVINYSSSEKKHHTLSFYSYEQFYNRTSDGHIL